MSGLASIGGCGGEAPRLPVEGAVTLDGQPLTKGQITFIPASGAKGPTAGAPVVEGRYAIAADRGPMAGTFRVEITATAPTSRKKRSMNVATGQMETVADYESIVPPQYNVDSDLTREVKAKEPNQLDFALKSQ